MSLVSFYCLLYWCVQLKVSFINCDLTFFSWFGQTLFFFLVPIVSRLQDSARSFIKPTGQSLEWSYFFATVLLIRDPMSHTQCPFLMETESSWRKLNFTPKRLRCSLLRLEVIGESVRQVSFIVSLGEQCYLCLSYCDSLCRLLSLFCLCLSLPPLTIPQEWKGGNVLLLLLDCIFFIPQIWSNYHRAKDFFFWGPL